MRSVPSPSFPLRLEVQPVPLCPEIRLELIAPEVDLEADARDLLAETAPFWAFCWASGQVLARYVLDHADLMRGRRVVDFGCGSGVVAIAAALAGAARVAACDCDPAALEATRRNAARNGVALGAAEALEPLLGDCDVLLASDVLYELPTCQLLSRAAARTELAILADPERQPRLLEQLPGLERLGAQEARTLPEIGEETRGAAVFWLRATAGHASG